MFDLVVQDLSNINYLPTIQQQLQQKQQPQIIISLMSHYKMTTFGGPNSPNLITLFPLEIHWAHNNDPIYKRYTALELKLLLNAHFARTSKLVKVRQVRYLESADRVQQKLAEPITIEPWPENPVTPFSTFIFSDFEDIIPVGLKTKAVCRIEMLARLQQQVDAVVEIYLYSRSAVRIWSNQRFLLGYPTGAKVKALVQIEPHQYESLDNFAINTSTARVLNTMFMHHPRQHQEYYKSIKTTTDIKNWQLSTIASAHSLAHYLTFTDLRDKTKLLNKKVQMSTSLIHSSLTEFDIVSSLFNGMVLKIEITKSNIKGINFYQDEHSDVFYFLLKEGPKVHAAVLNWKKSRDIEMFDDWESVPSWLTSRYRRLQNHPILAGHFLNNWVVVLQTQSSSRGSEYLKRVCNQVHSRVVLRFAYESHPMTQILESTKSGCYQSFVANQHIPMDCKIHVKYLLVLLLDRQQISLLEVLELFQMPQLESKWPLLIFALQTLSSDSQMQGLQGFRQVVNFDSTFGVWCNPYPDLHD